MRLENFSTYSIFYRSEEIQTPVIKHAELKTPATPGTNNIFCQEEPVKMNDDIIIISFEDTM